MKYDFKFPYFFIIITRTSHSATRNVIWLRKSVRLYIELKNHTRTL